ncbi:uncharacterized protein [Venturia canescens]|uniref:uncharacterized protein n=1 Tax=Venturia canescens TaxID=32260 RepID=UPI001C9C2348|nr:uncharacterized protein LOC122412965 [Venturia canescens]
MKFIALVAAIVAILVGAVSGQDYSQLFAGFGPYLQQSSGLRDPRSNTGPVVFPPGPAPNNAESSGVIVGASGFGFVPPNAGFLAYFY